MISRKKHFICFLFYCIHLLVLFFHNFTFTFVFYLLYTFLLLCPIILYYILLHFIKYFFTICIRSFNKFLSLYIFSLRFGPYFCEPVVAGLLDDNTPFLSGKINRIEFISSMKTCERERQICNRKQFFIFYVILIYCHFIAISHLSINLL